MKWGEVCMNMWLWIMESGFESLSRDTENCA